MADTENKDAVQEVSSEETKIETPAVAEEQTEKKDDASVDAPADDAEEVEVPEKFKNLISNIEGMSVLELHELVKVLEKKFGVSAAAMAVAVPGAGEQAEEKTSFNVELTDVGGQKIQVIKALKEMLGLGLKEAKDLVDAAPTELKAGMKKEDAEALKAKVEEAGGKVELK